MENFKRPNGNSEIEKVTITEIFTKGLNSRFALEETISKLEDRSVEIMYSEEQRENGLKNINRALEKCEMPLSTSAYT